MSLKLQGLRNCPSPAAWTRRGARAELLLTQTPSVKGLMSGREDDDVFWESWTSPGRRKRKKNSNKLRTGRDDDANKSQKRKKRCSKVKEAVAGGRESKKKEKKKKKKSVEACVCHRRAAAASTHTPAGSPPHAKKKLRRKKVVAFDLSPFCVRIKRPEFVSWSPQLPQQEGEGRSKARWAEPSQSQPLDDDDNSQDLFITQKTFRASPSESTSEQMEPQAVHTTEEEEEEEAGPSGRREERKMKMALIGEEECSYNRVNPYLATPPGLSVPQRCSRPPRAHRPRPLNAPPTVSTSTQTENFFTSQFSSFLSFCQWRQLMMSRHDAQPLDLSLRPARSSTRAPGESPPSPPSAEATASSEDNEQLSRSSKPDLTQVRAVQMRLNESFFFKTKGDGHSPRAESPLMKLSQGRGERKSRKNH